MKRLLLMSLFLGLGVVSTVAVRIAYAWSTASYTLQFTNEPTHICENVSFEASGGGSWGTQSPITSVHVFIRCPRTLRILNSVNAPMADGGGMGTWFAQLNPGFGEDKPPGEDDDFDGPLCVVANGTPGGHDEYQTTLVKQGFPPCGGAAGRLWVTTSTKQPL